MISDILFIASTLMWCQALPQRTLWFYAASVTATAVGKWLWMKGGW